LTPLKHETPSAANPQGAFHGFSGFFSGGFQAEAGL
jgi:hypothetical protein